MTFQEGKIGVHGLKELGQNWDLDEALKLEANYIKSTFILILIHFSIDIRSLKLTKFRKLLRVQAHLSFANFYFKINEIVSELVVDLLVDVLMFLCVDTFFKLIQLVILY